MGIEGEKRQYRALVVGCVMLRKQIPLARDRQQRPPFILGFGGILDQQPVVYVKQPGPPFRSLKIARQPEQIGGNPPQHNAPSTQVSLLPPPCDEFTIREPSRTATRVRPPANTRGEPPSSTNGLRSMWRGASSGLPSAPSTSVGCTDSLTGSWAI